MPNFAVVRRNWLQGGVTLSKEYFQMRGGGGDEMRGGVVGLFGMGEESF